LTTVVRSITVAAGAFAPGHLGELTRQVPFELVDSVLVQRRATERRLRALPSAGSAPVARHVIVDDSIGRPG
jgi:hypothetical protein